MAHLPRKQPGLAPRHFAADGMAESRQWLYLWHWILYTVA